MHGRSCTYLKNPLGNIELAVFTMPIMYKPRSFQSWTADCTATLRRTANPPPPPPPPPPPLYSGHVLATHMYTLTEENAESATTILPVPS